MKIDWLESSQHNSFVVLLCELYDYYNTTEKADPVLVKKHLTERLLQDNSPVRFLVAANSNGDVLGFAALACFFSLIDPRPDHSHHCVVEELFISDKHRRTGVAGKLMGTAAKWALDQGCANMDWNVRSTDFRGRRFYEGMGARIMDETVSYRITKDVMKLLVAR